MSARSRLLLGSTVLLIMLDTLRRLFAPNSEFLALSIWIAQMIVLVAVIGGVVRGALRRRKLKTRLAKLFSLLARSHNLQQNVPMGNDPSVIDRWSDDVRTWVEETIQYLDGYSHQAALSFQHTQKSSSAQQGVPAVVGERYGNLVQYIENLRGVMEKPEVYYG